MTTKPLIATALIALATAVAAPPAQAAGAYRWPVKPFDAPHPVRGSFGDPRTLFFGPHTNRTLFAGDGKFQFHFGVDVSAPNGTAVYPVESGVVTVVTHEEIDVACANGRSFEYWHLDAAVRPGEHVTAYRTVLGRIARPSAHVHLSELDGGSYVNPLRPGHLTPYRDTTKPIVTSIVVRRGANGLELQAGAADMPSLPVPGAWHGLPVTPARLTWRLQDAHGRVVVPMRVVYDVTQRLPSPATFWRVYARGTHQNMTTFYKYYAYREPGEYLFKLTPDGLDVRHLGAGTYEVVVTATDIAGNRGSLTKAVHLGA